MYDVLGLSKDASQDDIKKAYRKLAREHHPDKGGDAEKFKKVQEAYEILSDPQKRANFDQFGSAEGPQGPGAGLRPEDIFASMFGGAGSPFGFPSRGPVRRANHDHELRISFEDSYKGHIKEPQVDPSQAVPCLYQKVPTVWWAWNGPATDGSYDVPAALSCL